MWVCTYILMCVVSQSQVLEMKLDWVLWNGVLYCGNFRISYVHYLRLDWRQCSRLSGKNLGMIGHFSWMNTEKIARSAIFKMQRQPRKICKPDIIEHIQLPAKLLNYFLQSNKSKINLIFPRKMVIFKKNVRTRLQSLSERNHGCFISPRPVNTVCSA